MADTSGADSAFLDDLVARAKADGATMADAWLSHTEALKVTRRLGRTDHIERTEARRLGLRVFVGARPASVATTDIEPQNMTPLIERVLAMARVAPEDPWGGLADPDTLSCDGPALDMGDSVTLEANALGERARIAEDAALSVDGVTNSEGAQAGWQRTHTTLVTSGGFAGSYEAGRHFLSCSVLAGEGAAMERDYEYALACHLSDMEDPALLGARAGQKSVRRLHPGKVKSRRASLIYDPRIANGLLNHFAAAISGFAITRNTSFLKDHMEQAVFAPGIRIVDDPHRARGLRSRPFDDEGVGGSRRALVDDGHLQSWLLDSATARQLALKTTGHGARTAGGMGAPGPSNLFMEPGSLTPEALIAETGNGFYITELIGMGVNGVTGDYSRGAAGFRIENGKIGDPVSEITVAGNLKTMFAHLTPAGDLVFRYGINAPTLRLEGMTVAGA